MNFVEEYGDEYVSGNSETAKRIDYEVYTLQDLYDDDVVFTANKVEMSDMMEGEYGFVAFLNFYDDTNEVKIRVPINFKFKSNKIVIFKGHKLYNIINAIVKKDAEYYKIDFGEFRKFLDTITEIKIKSEYQTSDEFEWYDIVVLDYKVE